MTTTTTTTTSIEPQPFVLPEQSDLASVLSRHARERPAAIAAIDGERSISWSEQLARVHRVANALLALGVKPGDRVALLARNSLEYGDIFLGTLFARACIVPLPTLASAEAVALMLADSGSRVLIVAQDHADLVTPALPNLTTLLPNALFGLDFEDARFASYSSWVSTAAATPPTTQIEPSDLFNVIYSSGTTGVPKGIVHTHAVRIAGCRMIQALGFDTATVNIASTPLYSNTTITTWLPTLYWGGCNVLVSKFEASQFLGLVDRHRVTHAMLVPTQYERILRAPDFERHDLRSMKWKFCTSAPLREHVKRSIVARFPGELVEFYGLTEGGVSTILFANHNPEKLGSVGIAGGCELKIIDDAGHELPRGQTGEIVGRNWAMMRGYWNRDKATTEMVWTDAEGKVYLKTGDVGYLDADGFLYLSDRKKDMIISGGLNIYATDLENVLVKHEAVAEAAVIGVPSEDWGETPLALVVREPHSNVSADELLAWTNERLGKSQRLSGVELRDELPKSEIGKVQKRLLREPYWRDAQHERA